jgi:hypothetical protein
MSDPTPAHGADTLLDVLDAADTDGYGIQQIAQPDGMIECTSCSRPSASRRFQVEHVRRLEGASDAADLLLVALSVCPNCAGRGALVLGYGPNSTADDVAVLADLDLSDADPAPPDSSISAEGVDDPIPGRPDQ